MWRLFIAHPVPSPARERLWAQLAPYRRRWRAVRWTRPDTWHLTLLFLGSVAPYRLAELEALVDAAAIGASPYLVRPARGGGRSGRGNGVGWLGLSEGAGGLIGLAAALADECPPHITAGPPPRRTPSAHLTIARKVGEDVIDALRVQTHGPLGVEWQADRIALLRSHLEAGGARYETLHEATM